MKIGCLTAEVSSMALGSTVSASRLGRALFGKAGRLGLRLVAAFAALLFLAPLAIDQALGSNCEWSYRMNHSNSDCMHGWWDNSPPASAGYGTGSKWGVQSFCSNYGSVVAKIDLSGGADKTWTLNNGSKRRSGSFWHDVSGVYCCIDKGDMCIKQQVEESGNEIKYFVSGNSTLQTAEVTERIDRYNFCQDNPDTIYCEVDPQGDAHVAPNCGDHDCSVDDCNSNWDESDASETCRITRMNYDEPSFTQPECSLIALCENEDQTRGVNTQLTVEMSQVADLKECDLEVKLTC